MRANRLTGHGTTPRSTGAEGPARSKHLRPAAHVHQASERFELVGSGRAGKARLTLNATEVLELTAQRALKVARNELYRIAGGSYESADLMGSRLTVEQRIAYFKSPAFKNWVKAEKACGRQVFWLKDVDKTQASGDVFTFFFKWRADNNGFTEQQNDVLKKFLKGVNAKEPSAITDERIAKVDTNSAKENAYLILALWESNEAGGPGIGLIDFWSGAYWPSQLGLTREEKARQARAFAPHYAKHVFPHIPEDNRALTKAGVNVVIVSNGDQEVFVHGGAEVLGIEPENVVGSNLLYDANGMSTGVNHAYEIFEGRWNKLPQPGKPLSFHYWANTNKDRWHWSRVRDEQIVIAGRDGDSASSDGGMMILMKPAAIGNFIVDTPNEPGRAERFHELAERYGYGGFLMLVPSAPASGAIPD